MLIDDNYWFVVFWGVVLVLCLAEACWPTSGLDYNRSQRWPVNFGFGVFNGLLASLVPPLTVLTASLASDQKFGLLNVLNLPLWTAALFSFLVLSLSQYVFHRCAHGVPLLWEVHRVHHADEHCDASTALRFHPIEMLAALLVSLPVIILFGLPPTIVAAYEVCQIVIGLITHAYIHFPEGLERRLGWFFTTPVLHRFHHSADAAESNSNFGSMFSVWDRIFLTFRRPPRDIHEPATFGIAGSDAGLANNFYAQLRLTKAQRVGSD